MPARRLATVPNQLSLSAPKDLSAAIPFIPWYADLDPSTSFRPTQKNSAQNSPHLPSQPLKVPPKHQLPSVLTLPDYFSTSACRMRLVWSADRGRCVSIQVIGRKKDNPSWWRRLERTFRSELKKISSCSASANAWKSTSTKSGRSEKCWKKTYEWVAKKSDTYKSG